MSTEKPVADLSLLVGKFFHAYNPEDHDFRQGHITGVIPPNLVVVEFFDWVMGSRSDEIIIDISEMISPLFSSPPRFMLYDTAEDMNTSYEYHYKGLLERLRSEAKSS